METKSETEFVDTVVETKHNEDGTTTEVYESGNTENKDADGNFMGGTLHFWSTGDAMTRLARDFWVESPTKGLRFAMLTWDMTELQALQLLTGEKKLVGDTRRGDHTLAFKDDDAKERYGIPLSLSYHLIKKDQALEHIERSIHAVQFPWFYLDYNTDSPRKIDPAKNFKTFRFDGQPFYNSLSTSPLFSYRDFVHWVDYTTDGGKLPSLWYKTPMKPYGEEEILREKEQPMSTEEFMKWVTRGVQSFEKNIEYWNDFFGLSKTTRKMEFRHSLKSLKESVKKSREKRLQSPSIDVLSDENLAKMGDSELMEMAEKEIGKAKGYLAEDQLKIDALKAKATSMKAKSDKLEAISAPHKDWNPQRVRDAYESLEKATEDMMMQAMSNNTMMNSVTGDYHIDNLRMMEKSLITFGILKREPDVEPDEELTEPSGWLTQDGTYYHCWYMGHISLASALESHSKNAEAHVEDEGWIKVSELRIYFTFSKGVSEEQFKTLGRLIEKYGQLKYHEDYYDNLDALRKAINRE